eukprot:jgi/Mesvir1/5993/Mv00742-RA.1
MSCKGVALLIAVLLVARCSDANDAEKAPVSSFDFGQGMEKYELTWFNEWWEEWKSEKSGVPFYKNKDTGEVQWEHPYRVSDDAGMGIPVNTGFEAHAPSLDEELWENDDWKEWKTERGMSFFVNKRTGHSQWGDPRNIVTPSGNSKGAANNRDSTAAAQQKAAQEKASQSTPKSARSDASGSAGAAGVRRATGWEDDVWQEWVDENGRRFYQNKVIGYTQWKHPYDRTGMKLALSVTACCVAVGAVIVYFNWGKFDNEYWKRQERKEMRKLRRNNRDKLPGVGKISGQKVGGVQDAGRKGSACGGK